MSGRVGCAMCDGDGWISAVESSLGATVTDDGRIIMPCPLCVSRDKLMYGNAYIKRGVRIDPRTVHAERVVEEPVAPPVLRRKGV